MLYLYSLRRRGYEDCVIDHRVLCRIVPWTYIKSISIRPHPMVVSYVYIWILESRGISYSKLNSLPYWANSNSCKTKQRRRTQAGGTLLRPFGFGSYRYVYVRGASVLRPHNLAMVKLSTKGQTKSGQKWRRYGVLWWQHINKRQKEASCDLLDDNGYLPFRLDFIFFWKRKRGG